MGGERSGTYSLALSTLFLSRGVTGAQGGPSSAASHAVTVLLPSSCSADLLFGLLVCLYPFFHLGSEWLH